MSKCICTLCAHVDPESGLSRCTAYPEGIPDAILSGSEFHDEPRDGDGGITFQPKPGVDPKDLIFSRITLEEEVE